MHLRSGPFVLGFSWAVLATCAGMLAAGLGGCSSGSGGHQRGEGRPALVDADEAARGLGGDWVLLDVRPRDACERSHAKGARCLPLEAILPHPPGNLTRGARQRLARGLSRAGARWDTPLLVIGEAGPDGLQRAATACWLASLVETGPCHVLAGGDRAWRQAGGEVVSSTDDVDARGPVVGRVSPLHVPAMPVVWAGDEAMRHASIEPDVAIVQIADGSERWKVPGAFDLELAALLGAEDGGADDAETAAPSPESLIRELADNGLLAEEQVVVIGDGLTDGALGWFLLDSVAELPEVRLYAGGLERYRDHPHLPVMRGARASRNAPSESPAEGRSGASGQLDDREVDG